MHPNSYADPSLGGRSPYPPEKFLMMGCDQKMDDMHEDKCAEGWGHMQGQRLPAESICEGCEGNCQPERVKWWEPDPVTFHKEQGRKQEIPGLLEPHTGCVSELRQEERGHGVRAASCPRAVVWLPRRPCEFVHLITYLLMDCVRSCAERASLSGDRGRKTGLRCSDRKLPHGVWAMR